MESLLESLTALALLLFALVVPLSMPFWFMGLGAYLMRRLNSDRPDSSQLDYADEETR